MSLRIRPFRMKAPAETGPPQMCSPTLSGRSFMFYGLASVGRRVQHWRTGGGVEQRRSRPSARRPSPRRAGARSACSRQPVQRYTSDPSLSGAWVLSRTGRPFRRHSVSSFMLIQQLWDHSGGLCIDRFARAPQGGIICHTVVPLVLCLSLSASGASPVGACGERRVLQRRGVGDGCLRTRLGSESCGSSAAWTRVVFHCIFHSVF